MTDITTLNLEAAILDQKVAGEFRGKLYAFVAVQRRGAWILGVIVENENGYNPIDGKTFATREEALEWSNGLNEHLALSHDAVTDITISTMRRDRRAQTSQGTS